MTLEIIELVMQADSSGTEHLPGLLLLLRIKVADP